MLSNPGSDACTIPLMARGIAPSPLLRAAATGAAAALLCPALVAGAAPKPDAKADKQVCLSSYEKAQRLRADGKLRASREQAMQCARSVCPALLRKDCSQWLGDIDRTMPSVVVEARTADGRATADVKVYVDDELVSERAEPTPISVDPGWHVFRVVSADGPATEERRMLREGEQQVTLVLQLLAPPAPPPASAPPPVPPRPPVERRPVPATVWVFGGVGVAGLVGFTVFALKGNAAVSDLEACKPNCSQSRVDEMHRDYLVGDVLGAVGLVSLGVSAVLFASRPRVLESSSPPSASIGIGLQPRPGGAAAELVGRF
jgi:hypothetical protein